VSQIVILQAVFITREKLIPQIKDLLEQTAAVVATTSLILRLPIKVVIQLKRPQLKLQPRCRQSVLLPKKKLKV
jgi:hypothetical protein